MRQESEMINSAINEMEPTRREHTIKNLELLQYHAHKMNEIYKYQSSSFFGNAVDRNLLSAERWKMLRNVSVVLLYLSILFIKPGWCQSNVNMNENCTKSFGNTGETTVYYVIAPFEYIDMYNFEMISWVVTLVLIIYDLILVDINTRLIIVYCFLFLADVITCQLYFQGVLRLKLNLIFRVAFVGLYTWAYKHTHKVDFANIRKVPLAIQTAVVALRI